MGSREWVTRFTEGQKRAFAAICLLVVPLSGLCVDLYVPSLPAVAKVFHTSKAGAQFTITAYALGFAVGQLFAGVISDAYGRKRPMLLGCVFHVAAVVGILSTSSIGVFVALRALQGLCVAFTSVPARAVAMDIFKGERFTKFVNTLTIAWALGPIVAPFIGGYLQEYLSWRANFELMLIYVGVVFVGSALFLKETLPRERRTALSPQVTLGTLRMLLSHKQFVAAFVLLGLLYLPVICFSLVAPFIIEDQLGHSPVTFGHMALLVGVAWFAGNFANRFLGSVTYQRKTQLALAWCLAVSVVMGVMGVYGVLSLTALVVPTLLIVAPISMLFPVYMAQCFRAFPSVAASSNGVAYAGIYAVITLVTSLESQLHARSLLPLGATYAALVAFALVLYYAFLRTPWQGETPEASQG